MAGAMQTRISIYADDKASASFRKVAGEADSLVNKLLGMGPKVGDVLGNLGLGSLGLGLGVKELTGFIKDSSLAAARYQTLGLAMFKAGENAGYNAEQMSKAERELVKHGIALQDARQVLSQFATSNLEVARSGELARAAQDVAVSANTDSSAALQKMVHAIVSAQPEMLRTLGLAVSFEQAYAKAAQAMGKSVNALTEAEKMQVRFNATLEAASGYAGIYELSMTTASKQLGSFSRHWSNFQTLVGEVTLDSLSTAVFGVNDALEGLNNRLMDMKESGELEQISRKVGSAMGSVADNADTAALALAMWYTAVKVGNNATVQRIQSLSKEHGVMATLRAEIAGNTAMLGKDTAAYIANTEAAIANHKARLAAIDRGIGAKQSVIAEIATPEYATNLEAIRHRRTLEREVKVLQSERVVVTRQLTQATTAMAAATSRGNVALRAMNSLKAGASNIVSMFGGPLVLGLTAATAVLYHLATQENEATKYAREHADAMQLVSQNADVAKAALERYSNKLTEMNAQQREYERVSIQRSMDDITGAGQAYRDVYWAISPWNGNSDRTQEIRRRTQPLAELLLPSNFSKTTVDELRKARDEYAALAAEFDRTKEAAEGLETFDALIALKQQAEVASVAVQKIGDSAENALSSLQDLASVNFANLTANIEFEIGKIGLSDRNRAVLDNLIRNKVVEQQNVQLDGKDFSMTGLTPDAEQKVQSLASAYGTLFDRQQAARGSAKSLQTSLAGLNNELARLTMTEQEYARYQYERKFAELRRDLGATSPMLAEWARLQEAALNAGYNDANSAATHIREVNKAISELGLDEKEKQLRAFNLEMERLRAVMAAGVSVPFSSEQLDAYEGQRTKEITTGRTVDRDRQSILEFEKEYLSVMQSSEAAQIASIRMRAAEYEAAGVEAVRVAQWQSEMELRYSRDAFAGLKVGLRNYSSEASNMAKNTSTAITGIFDAMGNAFSFTAGKMKMDWSNMLDQMMNQAWKALVTNPLLGAMSKGLESFVGSFFGGGTATAGAEVQHTGGIIGAGTTHRDVPLFLFADAPRYHTGGKILRPGEVPVIAEAGERMLTKRENQLWERMLNGGAAGSPVELSVVLKNESGQPLQASNSQTQWSNDMKSAVVTIIIDAVNRNYMGAREALRGA